jgi:glycosyltransferase involved in cell wall biosynthesis
MTRPRILLWHWGRKGAGPQMLLSLARALAPRADLALSISAQSDLLAETLRLDLPCDAVPTYVSAAGFVAGFARLPGLRRRLIRQAQTHRADAVVSVMTHLWTPLVAPGLSSAGIAYLPLVHDAAPHPGDPAAFWSWRLRRELAAARFAFPLSEAVERQIRAVRPQLALRRMRLGAHLPPTALAAPRPRPAGPIRLLMFGRLRAYKGLDLLRDAWREVPEGRFTLRIVGDGPAEQLAPGLGSMPGVVLEPRWVAEAEIPDLLASADALVLPYREASQSGVIPMAHALGLPVVATPAGGLAEQLRDGVDGVIAEAVSAPALARALLRLAEAGALERLGEGARAHGANLADWTAQAELILVTVAEARSAAD